MDGKTKFLVAIVALSALYGIGLSYYRFIVLKDITIFYSEEEGEEDVLDESANEQSDEVQNDPLILEAELEYEVIATTTATTS